MGEPCSLAQKGQCVDGAVCYSSTFTEIPKCIKSGTQAHPCAYGAYCLVQAKICGASESPCTLDSQCAINTCVDSTYRGSTVNDAIPGGIPCSVAQKAQCVARSFCYSSKIMKIPVFIVSNTPGSNVKAPVNPNGPTPRPVVPGNNPKDPANPGAANNSNPGAGGLCLNSTFTGPSRSVQYPTSVVIINGVTTSAVVKAGATTTSGSGPSASPTESGTQNDGTVNGARLGTTLLSY